MSVKTVPMYVAVCDDCGKQHDGVEYVAWTDSESAVEVALASDWTQIINDDGTETLLCENCYGKVLAKEDDDA